MNIKKLIALSLSTMMVFSSVIASAEVTVDGSTITALPTLGEIQARSPKISFSVGEQYESTTAVEDDLSFLQVDDMSDDYIYFPLTITVSDLGSLVSGKGKINGTSFVGGCMLNAIQIALPTDKIKFAKVAVTTKDIGAASWLDDGIAASTWKTGWQAGSFAASYPVPDTKKGTIKQDNEFVAVANYVIGIDKNITEDVKISKSDITGSITYWVGDNTLNTTLGFASMTHFNPIIANDVTFKAPVITPTVNPWEVTITEEPAQAHGYIWKVDTTKGDGALTKFDVTFTDDTPETFERSILSATKDAYNWNAPTSFYVGLYTTRTGVTADWDIAAKDGETDVPVTLK